MTEDNNLRNEGEKNLQNDRPIVPQKHFALASHNHSLGENKQTKMVKEMNTLQGN